jgi:hypothetical protein
MDDTTSLNNQINFDNSNANHYNNNYLIPDFANLQITSSVNNNCHMFISNENKFICNFEIQIGNDEYFRVTKRIIGNKGLYLKSILYDCCGKFGDYSTKIRLRGRGSGFKEGPNHEGIII